MPKTCWIVVLATLLVLLLLGHGFGAERSSMPTPEWSQVHYDPNLTEDLLTRLLKIVHLSTDKCYFTSFGIRSTCAFKLESLDKRVYQDHIQFTLVKLPDPTEPRCLEDCDERLSVKIMDGRFWCSYLNFCYWRQIACFHSNSCYRYLKSVKRQELTLDKRTYRLGDVIIGRIDFECLVECPESPEKPEPVMVKGIFKTILK
jgi:hypothetical protein